MKRYNLKLAMVSGCCCYGVKKYLNMTRKYILDGYSLTKI